MVPVEAVQRRLHFHNPLSYPESVMSKVFVTDRKNKGLEVVAGKYQFFNGVMPVSDADAEKLEPILCRFYGCTVEDATAADEKSLEELDPSLSASLTKAAEAAGAGGPVEAMMAFGEAAGDPTQTGTISEGDPLVGAKELVLDAENPIADPKPVDAE